MSRDGVLGDLATYGGSVGSCSAAAASASNESTILMWIAIASFLIAAAGLVYSVWNGNRQFKLQQLELELKLKQQGAFLEASLPKGVTTPMGESHGSAG